MQKNVLQEAKAEDFMKGNDKSSINVIVEHSYENKDDDIRINPIIMRS